MEVDYRKNLYDWNVSKNEIQIVDNQLAKVDALLDNSLVLGLKGMGYDYLEKGDDLQLRN